MPGADSGMAAPMVATTAKAAIEGAPVSDRAWAAGDLAEGAHVGWMAEAAITRVLRRTLPAQRHDVLGSLAALQLQLATARRTAARETTVADPGVAAAPAVAVAVAGDALGRLDAMVQPLQQARSALALLRLWDGVAGPRLPLDGVLDQCVAWSRQAAALQGHRLENARGCSGGNGVTPTGTTAAQAPPMVSVPDAHQLLLALLCEAIDRHRAPVQLVPRWCAGAAGWTVWLDVCGRGDVLPPMAESPPAGTAIDSGNRIDADLLRALARHLSRPGGAQWQLLTGARAVGAPVTGLRCRAVV